MRTNVPTTTDKVRPRIRQPSAKLVLVLAGLAFVLGTLTLVGESAGVALLVSVRPEFRAMSTVTATGVLLLAAGLIAACLGGERAGRAAGALASGLAMAVLVSYMVDGADNVSPWWSAHVLRLPAELGKTSRSTAVALGLIAVALMVQSRPRLADVAAAGSLILSTVALLGYAYGVGDLYALASFDHMALNTATALFLMSTAALCLRPGVGWSAIVAARSEVGGATRRQLVFCLLPPLIGWVVVRALHAGWLGIGAAMALFVAATIIPLALLILRDGTRLVALEEERRSRDETLAAAAQDAQVRLADQASRLQSESAERAKVEGAMYRTQRLDAIGQLTGGIAHDFNNLLMAIGGSVQLLKRRLPADDPLRRYVDNMSVAVVKGSKVTQQLLAFSRSQRLDIKPTPIEAAIVKARQLIGTSLGPLIKVETHLQADGAWASCDADQLELSLLNLAVNSRDAMPSGGILTITCSLSEMERPQCQREPCVLVRVTDTGAGMAPDVAAHAAEPFFTTKDRGKGTGLGLAQVYGFVLQCKGDVRILSAPGEGTSVEMRFPLAAASTTMASPSTAPAQRTDDDRGAVKQLRVIVIDDDDGVRDVIVQALTDAGYDVVAAIDGTSGLAEMASFKPAAAVIDFIMPGMHGADVARAAQAKYPGLPIIFVSGYSETAALEGVSGASVLRKPFDVSTLTRMVDMAVAD